MGSRIPQDEMALPFWKLLITGLTLVLFCLLYFWLVYDLELAPFEDAAMLMRYAANLEEGMGIVWNPGEAPVDGATDFLFMVAVAITNKSGINLETSVRLLSMGSHLLTLLLLMGGMVYFFRAPLLLTFVTGLFLASGPALLYVESYFGTPFFAFFGLLSWAFALKVSGSENPGQSWGLSIGFAMSSLLMGLTRPEGVFLAGFMLISLVLFRGWRACRKVIISFLMIFGTLGTIYFVWHWHYFGYPLPNPFYIKGGGSLHLFSLKMSVFHVLMMTWPVFLVIFFQILQILQWFKFNRPEKFKQIGSIIKYFNQNQDFKKVLFHLIPVAGFTAIWILMSNAMNYGMRFQYILLPIMLLSWIDLAPKKLIGQLKKPLLLFPLMMLLLGYNYLNYGHGHRFYPDGRQILGESLKPYSQKGYTMAISEAGNLALSSDWKAIDTWGLNDREIAHSGLITEAYLDRYQPEIIMFHEYKSPQSPDGSLYSSWSQMVTVLENYALKNQYTLVAAWGTSPENTHYYYVKPDFEDSETISALISGMKYPWYESGEICTNYAIP